MAKATPAQVGLALAATGLVYEVYSALMSSPWTAENFGADAEKSASARKYMWISTVNAAILGLGFSLLAGNHWPLVGTTVVSIFFILIYSHALKKGAVSGSTGWARMPKDERGPIRFRPTES
jgi:lipoprotein signal peptidase